MKAGSKGSSTKLSVLDPDTSEELCFLKEQFDAAPKAYEELRRSCEDTVIRWVWTTSRRYHLDPLYFLDPEESAAGEVLESAPKDRRGCAEYGFAGDGRLVVEHLHVSSLPESFYKTFYLTRQDRIVSYHFHYAPVPRCINCALLKIAGGSPAHYLRWAVRGWVSHRYVTMEGKIHSFHAVFREEDEPETRYAGELRYSDDGCIELWTRWQGSRQFKLTFRGKQHADNPFLAS